MAICLSHEANVFGQFYRYHEKVKTRYETFGGSNKNELNPFEIKFREELNQIAN